MQAAARPALVVGAPREAMQAPIPVPRGRALALMGASGLWCGHETAEGRTLNLHDTGGDHAGPGTSAGRLVDLLDYVEQVVRLDERVAYRLADYRLPDGDTLALRSAEVAGLSGVETDLADGDAPAWLAVDRLARLAPPPPPAALVPWLQDLADPATPPAPVPEMLRTVSAAERAALIAADRAAEEDFAPVPARAGVEGHGDHDLRLRFADQSGLAEALDAYRAGPWAAWAAGEAPRRRTMALYGRLYRLQQLLELGGGEGAVEAVWGVGTVRWSRGGRAVDRPLLECPVELDLAPDGRLSVRPTGATPRFDLKPYDEMGCAGLPALDAALRAGLAEAEADEGVSPFRPASFAPLLRVAATRLSAGGSYADAPIADAAPASPPSSATGSSTPGRARSMWCWTTSRASARRRGPASR